MRLRSRLNSTLKRDELINTFGAIVDSLDPESRHTVELSTPEVVVVVEVIKSICGISVIHAPESFGVNFNFAAINQEIIKQEAANVAEKEEGREA